MAEYVAVPESSLVPLPGGLSVDGAGLAQPLAVGLHAARRSGARSGDRVVLIGAGAIGSFTQVGLGYLADVDLTVIDFPGPRLDRAARLGATRTLAAGPDNAEALVATLGPQTVDVVIEASGAPGQLDHAISLVRNGGTILQVGLPARRQEVDVHSLVMREITVAHHPRPRLRPGPRAGAGDPRHHPARRRAPRTPCAPSTTSATSSNDSSTGRLDGKVLFDPSLPPTAPDPTTDTHLAAERPSR